ncbi:hypothetical protein ACROYT_G043574 [Oculina patagonica]
MSINDKVKVFWKTNCQWRDRPHWPKRREIKLQGNDSNEELFPLLKDGDLVKIKFGSRWYAAEVAEPWNPKEKKAAGKRTKTATPTATEATETPPAIKETAAPVSEASVTTEPPATCTTPVLNYEQFVADQKKREQEWKANRAVKKPKVDTSVQKTVVEIPDGDSGPTSDQPSPLQKQLDAKTDECCRLRSKLEKLHEDTAETARKQIETQERLFKMMESMQKSMTVMEEKVSVALTKIEDRLDSLETKANSCTLFDSGVNYSTPNIEDTLACLAASEQPQSDSDDLPTIDSEALATLCGDTTFPETEISSIVNPGTPPPQCLPVTVSASPSSPANSLVSAELIRTCVTPSKVSKVQQMLSSASERHRCALKLLPSFFNKEELSSSNTDGTHGKLCLDGTKLNALKVLVFTKFPANSPSDMEGIWRDIKGRINSKCRTTKYFAARCL